MNELSVVPIEDSDEELLKDETEVKAQIVAKDLKNLKTDINVPDWTEVLDNRMQAYKFLGSIKRAVIDEIDEVDLCHDPKKVSNLYELIVLSGKRIRAVKER